MLVLHGYVSWSKRTFECVECCPRIAVAAASGAIKFHRLIQPGCMKRQVARRDESINAHSAAHNVVPHSIDDGIFHSSLGQVHVSISNSLQRSVQQQFVITKIGSASVKCGYHMSVSIWSS